MSRVPSSDGDDEDVSPKRDSWRLMKNVLVIAIAFMMLFTAYHGASNLQSSINAKAGLGTASLAAVYAGIVLSSLLLPAAVIECLGTKWTVTVSMLCYMPYIAAQLHPTFYTMIPTAFILGMGGGTLWCAKCTYVSMIAEAYNKITGAPVETLITRILGIFFTIFQTNQIWGNLISSLVLSSDDNKAAVTMVNESMIPELCGAHFLPKEDSEKAFHEQPPEKILMLAGIYLAFIAAAAIIVAVGVDSMSKQESARSSSSPPRSVLGLLSVTVRLLAEPNQLMLVVLNVFNGMQHAYFTACFSAAFVSCVVGTGTVGYVMMAHGLGDVAACALTGYVVKMTGRLPLIVTALLVHSAMFATLLAWLPHADENYVLVIISVLWGICNAVWLVQINAYHGILFPDRKEAAFSNFRMWDSMGFIIVYIISPYLRTSTMTYLLFMLMIVGSILYFIVEYKEFIKEQKKVKEKIRSKGEDNAAFMTVF